LRGQLSVFFLFSSPVLLLLQAIEHDCLFVQGATMLLEQGMEQFELWHKRRAPRVEMDAAVFNGVERLD
jgi:shikimate 5-dehydrogenase